MKMKKFINDPENLTPELLEGFVEAHKDLVRLGDERMVINRKLDEEMCIRDRWSDVVPGFKWRSLEN